MIRAFPQHCFAHFSADFPAYHRAHVEEVADSIHKSASPEYFQVGPGGTVLRWPSISRLASIATTRIGVSTLGLTAFENSWSFIEESCAELAKHLELKHFRRLGVKIEAHLPVGLSHAEAIELFFGSIIGEKEQLLSALNAKSIDPILNCDASLANGREAKIELTPVSSVQFVTTVPKLALEPYMSVPVLDENVRSFLQPFLNTDLLVVSVDIFTKDAPCSDVAAFLRESVEEIDQICSRVVALLKSKPIEYTK